MTIVLHGLAPTHCSLLLLCSLSAGSGDAVGGDRGGTGGSRGYGGR